MRAGSGTPKPGLPPTARTVRSRRATVAQSSLPRKFQWCCPGFNPGPRPAPDPIRGHKARPLRLRSGQACRTTLVPGFPLPESRSGAGRSIRGGTEGRIAVAAIGTAAGRSRIVTGIVPKSFPRGARPSKAAARSARRLWSARKTVRPTGSAPRLSIRRTERRCTALSRNDRRRCQGLYRRLCRLPGHAPRPRSGAARRW